MEIKNEGKVVFSRNKIGGEIPIVVNEIVDECLYSGFFGTLDSARMKSVSDRVLTLAENKEAKVIIVDLSNVEIIDSAVSQHLVDLARTLKLVGMEVVFCGIAPIVAQSIIKTGIQLGQYTYTRNLKAALEEVLKLIGLKLVKDN